MPTAGTWFTISVCVCVCVCVCVEWLYCFEMAAQIDELFFYHAVGPSVLWLRCFDGRNGIRSVKKTESCIRWWWWSDCSFARLKSSALHRRRRRLRHSCCIELQTAVRHSCIGRLGSSSIKDDSKNSVKIDPLRLVRFCPHWAISPPPLHADVLYGWPLVLEHWPLNDDDDKPVIL